MKNIVVVFFSIVLASGVSAQTLQSPEQFLGYKVGTRFTPHHKIVAYVRSVAQAVPSQVKVEKYGETYEGRDLLLAYIGSAANIQRLEAIRTNNLQLAGLANGNAPLANAPAIVWLSYNVHGNEPSSSEAAMLALHALVDPTNTQTKKYLENTVVIIDPCLNPDGRDRYVNWYSSVAAKTPDPNPQAREHSEPWPGGRSNHYNFDLNRDWAWQTQVETRQRIVKYNQWMPHVHVDFHEQFHNNPYYFAPAAEPFHEVITPWQRSFQTTIGINNARYFDQQGWLFFTKESFDLLYPSYGDTYPTYNGAIGMTYEQAGHSRGGLAIRTDVGDTLTLVDRAQHHFTTSISTVEVASQHAGQLVNEFKKFFDDSRSGKGNQYKTYIMTSDNEEKLRKLAELLTLNGISYGSTRTSGVRGMNYNNSKMENVNLKRFHIAVSTAQPRSVLAKVLLDPHTALPDSNTYDITAWALPYAHGVDAYAVREALPIQPAGAWGEAQAFENSSYGYLIKYNSVAGVRMMSELLREGIRIRYAEQPFTYKGKQYSRGTMIVLVQGNKPALHETLTRLARTNVVEIDPLRSGFMEQGPDVGSPYMRYVQTPRVALVTGEQVSSLSAGQVWHFFEQQINYPVTLINASDIGRANLQDFNVIIFPDGYFKAFGEESTNNKLKDYVRGGGRIIAMENAVQLMAGKDWGLKQREEKPEEKSTYANLRTYANREREGLTDHIPGAIYRVHLDRTHPLAFGYDSTYYSLKLNGDVYEYMKDGWNVGYFKRDNYVTGFAGTNVKARLVDGLNFGVQEMGRGSVIYFVDDPLFRAFWENGKQLFANAVFLVGQ
ncbi:M14 metallopeptidase family protein [Aridibaculum aurantiacum]|uniref:M14 metallopeptidase family protein n=1 Tax=Aridibaculum aurantiacum TaxID=2810307 RepID=UPI001F606C60|nr:M14 metallopeptidase family protein [Aridibaculum aurantiacum]